MAGVDDQPQLLVANAFKARAALVDPQYILNVAGFLLRGFNLSYDEKETIVFTIDPYYGNLN